MADPVEQLGPFPLLQLALGTIITLIGALAAWRGIVKKPDASPPATAGPAVQWFLDGPVGKALGVLDGIYREIRQGREDAQRFANEQNKKHDEQIALLREILRKQDEENRILDDVKDRLHDMQAHGRKP